MMNKPLYIVSLIICVILSALFSGAEMAYAKVNKLRLKREIEETNNKTAKLSLELSEKFGSTLSTILIGNNLVNIAASSVATILFVELLGEQGELWATIVMTIVILTFGEILPKSIASSTSYSLSKILAYPIEIIKIILTPLVKINEKLVNFVGKIFKKKEEVDEDDLQAMVDTMEEQGVISEETSELISNAIDFIDCDAIEIMVHRTDVFSYDINDSFDKLYKDPKLLDYSRILIYDETIDNVVGILNTKQFIKMKLNEIEFDVKDIISEPLYVFETQSVSDILHKLRKNHIHLAVVKDEYGGTSGILTIEDIVEELVGEIYDEKDEEETEEFHKVSKNRFTVDGDMNIFDFFDIIDYDYADEEYVYTTVGGWITDKLEKFPKTNDTFEFNGYRIKVIKATRFTVERVSVLRLSNENESKDD